jgi:hypothetical protein
MKAFVAPAASTAVIASIYMTAIETITTTIAGRAEGEIDMRFSRRQLKN